MMRQLLIYIGMAALLAGCRQTDSQPQAKEAFTTEVRLKTTPVKNQGASSLCWVYAMLATIETEHLMQGDSVNLSPDYVGRMFLREQAMEGRNAQAATGTEEVVTTRGVATMLLRMLANYGIVHYDAYHRKPDCNYHVLCRKLGKRVRNRSVSPPLSLLAERTDKLLDEAIGPAPRFVYMFGCEYTALEFAHSVCRDDEYEALTSFSHHPFGERFPLEVADNRYHDTFLNVPIDSLMRRIDRALRHGHPVCWEGDTSEPGFAPGFGTARLQHDDETVTQEHRQQSFEDGKTTDDHCMEIVGIAHDAAGKKYYIMKNSWGTDNPYGGFMYVSENYVRLKTVAIVLSRAA